MDLIKKQKVIVRKKSASLRDKKLSLSERIARYTFTGEVLSVNDTTVEVHKLDSESFYGKSSEKEIVCIDTDSDEYDIQPLRTEAWFQSEPRAISVF